MEIIENIKGIRCWINVTKLRERIPFKYLVSSREIRVTYFVTEFS